MIFNTTGGGGAPLNFKVVGGTSTPSSPEENTIWVNTSTEISRWLFSPIEPTSPKEGMVWFFANTSSSVTFNALKKDNIRLCPTVTKQYENSTWVTKTAQGYQNGKWTKLQVSKYYIFQAGVGPSVTLKHSAAEGMSASHTTASIIHKVTGAAQLAATWGTSKIKVKGYTRLCAKANCTYVNNVDVSSLGFTSTQPSDYYFGRSGKFIAFVDFQDNDTTQVYSVLVPNGVESAYIAFGGGSQVTVYDIWLE